MQVFREASLSPQGQEPQGRDRLRIQAKASAPPNTLRSRELSVPNLERCPCSCPQSCFVGGLASSGGQSRKTPNKESRIHLKGSSPLKEEAGSRMCRGEGLQL